MSKKSATSKKKRSLTKTRPASAAKAKLPRPTRVAPTHPATTPTAAAPESDSVLLQQCTAELALINSVQASTLDLLAQLLTD